MASTPPNWNPNGPGADPNQPFDPTNGNDPRYDPSRDPRYDPRWQKAQQKFYRDQQRAQAGQDRAARRAQAAAWKAQGRAQRDQWKMYSRGQRRTSIVGPLMLITFGLVFFLVHTGRIAPPALMDWFGRWWPILLIVVGLLRLAEWGIDRARQPEGAPPLRYNMGGGVVALIVLVVLVGLSFRGPGRWHADGHGFGFLGPWANGDVDHFFGQKHEEDPAAVTRDIAATGAISVDNPHGDVVITGTSDDGKVHLSVHKQVYTNSDNKAADLLRDLTPTLDGDSSTLTLRVPGIESGSADVTLLVPATVHVMVNSNRGDVRVTNVKAPLTVTSNNGEVEIAAITGNVQVHSNHRRRDVNVRSVTGDVSIDGNGDEVTLSDITGAATVNGDFYGGAHLQHIGSAVTYHSSRTELSFGRLNGELEIDGNDLTASEAAGPMLVTTRSRNISLDRVTGDIKVVNNHGDVNLHVAPPTGAITVDNQNGNVSVTLPNKAKFTLSAETSDGDTHSEFDGSQTHGGRGMLSGAINGGGPSIRLNTSHGDINVGRNDAAPLPQAPPTPHLASRGTTSQDALDQNVEAMQRNAMAIAADALQKSADAMRDSKADSESAKEHARRAMEEARQAMKEAQEKQRDAARLAREAAKSRTE